MTVHFIGAGPGAPDLITLRARDLIAACPVCLYAGSLVPEAILAHCPPGAQVVNTAPMDLDQIRQRHPGRSGLCGRRSGVGSRTDLAGRCPVGGIDPHIRARVRDAKGRNAASVRGHGRDPGHSSFDPTIGPCGGRLDAAFWE